MLLTHLDCLNLAHWLHNTASEDGLSPLCFALVDLYGELIWFERMDTAPAYHTPIAIAKAYTALRLECTTQEFQQQLQNHQWHPKDYMDPKLTAIAGGAPLYSIDGRLAGAIGICSHKTEHDQALADLAAMHFLSL